MPSRLSRIGAHLQKVESFIFIDPNFAPFCLFTSSSEGEGDGGRGFLFTPEELGAIVARIVFGRCRGQQKQEVGKGSGLEF